MSIEVYLLQEPPLRGARLQDYSKRIKLLQRKVKKVFLINRVIL